MLIVSAAASVSPEWHDDCWWLFPLTVRAGLPASTGTTAECSQMVSGRVVWWRAALYGAIVTGVWLCSGTDYTRLNPNIHQCLWVYYLLRPTSPRKGPNFRLAVQNVQEHRNNRVTLVRMQCSPSHQPQINSKCWPSKLQCRCSAPRWPHLHLAWPQNASYSRTELHETCMRRLIWNSGCSVFPARMLGCYRGRVATITAWSWVQILLCHFWKLLSIRG